MNDDDEDAALAHQMELEIREQEEKQLMERCRVLTHELRIETKQFEADMNDLNQRIQTNWRNFNGNNG